MKKVTIYVRNKDINPSGYYRIIQYIDLLEINPLVRSLAPDHIYKRSLKCQNRLWKAVLQAGIYICMLVRVTVFLNKDIKESPDFVFIQRELIPKYMPLFLMRKLLTCCKNSRIIWDFDDDIFLNGEISERELKVLYKNAWKVITTSRYLKNKLPGNVKDRTMLMPTTDGGIQNRLDETVFLNRNEQYEKRIVLVWVGTSSNLSNLRLILRELEKTAMVLKSRNKKELLLKVICDNRLTCDRVSSLKIEHYEWTRETAIKEILNAHIGLMPLPHQEYTKGKAGFKLVQYMAAGLPVIASDIGYNREIINGTNGFLVDDSSNKKGWLEAVLNLSTSLQVYSSMSQKAAESWQDKFDFQKSAESLNRLFL